MFYLGVIINNRKKRGYIVKCYICWKEEGYEKNIGCSCFYL